MLVSRPQPLLEEKASAGSGEDMGSLSVVRVTLICALVFITTACGAGKDILGGALLGREGLERQRNAEAHRQVEAAAGIEKPAMQLSKEVPGDKGTRFLVDDGHCTADAYAAVPVVTAEPPSKTVVRDRFGARPQVVLRPVATPSRLPGADHVLEL